ncbi:MAG: threonyl-tRNA synthetase editing domain-containing protein [Chloroflexi bacterium]|nr:threonyl-tRNA synthetase editing domain-containing protein [Chloroflexota bacterium]
MRILMLHVDYFYCKITEKGRSKVVEELRQPETRVDEALVVLSSVERSDEDRAERTAERAAQEITTLARQLKVGSIVLHPFAHLFAELSRPEPAIQIMKKIEERLNKEGFQAIRTPFGWFNTLELKAKGHPLSRVARIISD